MPLYMSLPEMASRIHCITPPIIEFKYHLNFYFRSALLNMGYEVSISHVLPQSIKTNAPMSDIWGVLASWSTRKSGITVRQENDESCSLIINRFVS